MKKIFGLLLLLFFVSFATVSCSSDNNPKKENSTEQTTDPNDNSESSPDIVLEGIYASNEIIGDDKKFTHKVLLEVFTGTWCGNCPIMRHSVEEVKKIYPNVFEVAKIHGGKDPMALDQAALSKFLKKLGTKEAYPQAFINREKEYKGSSKIISDVKAIGKAYKKSSPIGIIIKANLGKTNGTIDISIKSSEYYKDGLMHTIYVLEDGIIHPQANYTKYFDPKDGKSENYVHNQTLIGLSDGFEGRLIPADLTKDGKEYKREGIIINYKARNVNNLSVLVIVTDKSGKVLNTLSAKKAKENE